MPYKDFNKILLVEDDSVMAMLKIRQLGKYGYKVHHASTGEKAVAFVKDNPDNIDIILMDIDLGEGIDGTEAAQQILSIYDIPILFLSMHTEPEVVEKTEKITSYGYVVKDSGIIVLDASIKMALKLFDSKMREKEKEQRLIEAKNLLYTAFEVAPAALLIFKAYRNSDNHIEDFTFFYLNRKAEDMIQMKSADVLGKKMCDMLPVNRDMGFLEKYIRVVETGESLEEEFYLPETNVPAAWHYHNVIKSGDGILIIHTDITEQKKYELALLESNMKYKQLYLSAGIGIGYYNPDGTIISYNELAAKHMNGTPQDFAGKSIYEVFPKSEADEYVSRIQQTLKSDVPISFEDMIALPSGKYYFISTFTKITDYDKNILGVQIISQDITAQKLIEEELRYQKEQYENIVDMSCDLIAVHQSGVLTYINSKGAELLGHGNPDEIIGKSIFDYILETHTDEAKSRIEKLNNSEDCRSPVYTTQLRKQDGTIINIKVRGCKIQYNGIESIQLLAHKI